MMEKVKSNKSPANEKSTGSDMIVTLPDDGNLSPESIGKANANNNISELGGEWHADTPTTVKPTEPAGKVGLKADVVARVSDKGSTMPRVVSEPHKLQDMSIFETGKGRPSSNPLPEIKLDAHNVNDQITLSSEQVHQETVGEKEKEKRSVAKLATRREKSRTGLPKGATEGGKNPPKSEKKEIAKINARLAKLEKGYKEYTELQAEKANLEEKAEKSALKKYSLDSARYCAKEAGVSLKGSRSYLDKLRDMPKWKRAVMYTAVGGLTAIGVGIGAFGGAALATWLGSSYFSVGAGTLAGKIGGGLIGHKFGRSIFGKEKFALAKAAAAHEKLEKKRKKWKAGSKEGPEYKFSIFERALDTLTGGHSKRAEWKDKQGFMWNQLKKIGERLGDNDLKKADWKKYADRYMRHANRMPAVASAIATMGTGAVYHGWGALFGGVDSSVGGDTIPTAGPTASEAVAGNVNLADAPAGADIPPVGADSSVGGDTIPSGGGAENVNSVIDVSKLPEKGLVFDVTTHGRGESINTVWDGLRQVLDNSPEWNKLSHLQQNISIDAFKDLLQSNHRSMPELLASMGIDSGNIDIIRDGTKIDFRPLIKGVMSNEGAMSHVYENVLRTGNVDQYNHIKNLFGSFLQKFGK